MADKLPYEIFTLDKQYTYLLEKFNCGNDEIDRYVKEDALQDMYSGKGVTYLVTDLNLTKLIAYYTLSESSLLYTDTDDITNKCNVNELRICGLSAIEIKMFAVNKSYQDYFHYNEQFGNELFSAMILGSVIGDIYTYSLETLGIQMIFLYSTVEAVEFYKKNNFILMNKYIPLYSKYTEDCVPMYLPLYE